MKYILPVFKSGEHSFVALLADSDGRCDQVRNLEKFARACLVIRDAARITSVLQYLHTSHVQLSSFVKMYFFNACYRRFVNNQVLFSSVQRHQIIFATKDFSRGEFFVLTVF